MAVWLLLVAVIEASAQDMGMRSVSQAAVLASSVHRSLTCRSCHGEMSLETGARPDPVGTCARCHAPEAQARPADDHGIASRAGNAAAPTCVTCHGSHDVLSRRDPLSRTHASNVPAQCGTCHQGALTTYREGIHGTELAQNNLSAATCTNCHTAHNVARPDRESSTVAPVRVATTCAACHREAGAQYSGSVHATATARRAPHGGTCVDCHGGHAIRTAAEASSPAAVLQVAGATCGTCHGSVRLTEMHRLPASIVTDFRGSFHGLAGALGDRRVANCASCHGYHEVRPSWDPRSRIATANLPATCGQCHAGAGPGFARGGIHHLPQTPGHRLVDLTRLMYRMMIVSIIGLMVLHNAIDFSRRWRDRRVRRRHPTPAPSSEPRTYQRFTLNERIQHWLLAGSFITLAVTGFALTEGWDIPWVEGQTGATLRASTHRTAAVVFILLTIYHVAYLAFTRRGRRTIRDMVPRLRNAATVVCCAASCLRLGPPSPSDWRDLIHTVKYNLGLTTDRPRHGRFTYAEKMEYFALAWGAVVMIATGLALWFEVPFLNRFPFWSFELATVVHLYEALLASLAIVAWHFYFTMFNPDVFPLSKVMITGRMTHEEMEHEHADELCEIDRREDAPH
ncbi:MAG: cytochrome c3 family protein [Cyanobacteria bacterium]|nr:cytochrome c3 family protein [Cyanobacteriota bacterium]